MLLPFDDATDASGKVLLHLEFDDMRVVGGVFNQEDVERRHNQSI
jgi:hypothetical protein